MFRRITSDSGWETTQQGEEERGGVRDTVERGGQRDQHQQTQLRLRQLQQ